VVVAGGLALAGRRVFFAAYFNAKGVPSAVGVSRGTASPQDRDIRRPPARLQAGQAARIAVERGDAALRPRLR